MKKLIFLGSLLVLGSVAVAAYGFWAQEKQNVVDRVRWQESKDSEKYASLVTKFNGAKSKDEYLAVEKELSALPKKHQEALTPQIKLRMAMLNFAEAEDLLNRARALQASLSVPPLPPEKRQVGVDNMGNPVFVQDQAPPPEIHPMAMKLLEKAIPLYNDSKKEMDRLTEVKGDNDYNFRLNYVKGEVYHRYTQLFATQETAKELFNQTVTFYKQALRYKPADTNTVINIELLIRDEQGMGGGAGQPQQQRSKLLNQQAGHGHSKGN